VSLLLLAPMRATCALFSPVPQPWSPYMLKALTPASLRKAIVASFAAAREEVAEEMRREAVGDVARGRQRCCFRCNSALFKSPLLRALNVAFGRRWKKAGLYLALARVMLCIQPLLIRVGTLHHAPSASANAMTNANALTPLTVSVIFPRARCHRFWLHGTPPTLSLCSPSNFCVATAGRELIACGTRRRVDLPLWRCWHWRRASTPFATTGISI
jgi:hypothetical protein